MPVRVAIIGGGASGMVAAIAASRAGAEVRLFEKGERVGRKLLATGNGRCNLKIGRAHV
jgi:predicted flavoprotein YhiN